MAFVTRAGQQLWNGTLPWRAIGFNIWNAAQSFTLPNATYLVNNGTTLADTLTAINAGGAAMNVIRVWFTQMMVTPTTSGYTWAPFDKVLTVAAAAGFKVIAVLADEWDFQGPPQKDYNWFNGGYKTDFFQGTVGGIAVNENVPYYQYIQDVTARYASNATIAWWELINEPDASNDDGTCSVTAPTVMAAFVADCAGKIKSIDTNHLVSIGTTGTGACGTDEANYGAIHDTPYVDLCSFHDYLGAANATASDTFNGLNTVVPQAAALGKPVYVGECGISLNNPAAGGNLGTRASLLNAKMSAQLAMQGVAGFLPWQFDERCPPYQSSGTEYRYGTADPALAVAGYYAVPVYAYGGQAPAIYCDYTDIVTGRTLTAVPGGTYSMVAASTRAGLTVPPPGHSPQAGRFSLRPEEPPESYAEAMARARAHTARRHALLAAGALQPGGPPPGDPPDSGREA